MKKFVKSMLSCACVIFLMGTMMSECVMESSAATVENRGGMIPEEQVVEGQLPTPTQVNEVQMPLPLSEKEEEKQTTVEVPVVEPYVVQTPYDKSIFVENGMEFHYVAGDTWQGLMVIVKDPSRVFVGMPRDSYTGAAGANATFIGKRYNAMYAVNGAFFVDTDFHGNGGTPIGFVFSEGKQKAGGAGTAYALMGLTNDNTFVCATMTGAQAVALGVRDAVSCGPILVQNGAVADLSSKSTTLMDARTAVGARADGCILILQVDGRMSHSIGATTRDLAECMISFGAVSAGNLDGGGSVSNYYTGTPIVGLSSKYGSRPVPNAICVRPE